MLAIEHEACLRVIEGPGRGIPLNQREVLAIVVGVALDAGRGRRAGWHESGMQALALLHTRCNVAVALQAAEVWRTGRYRMALHTAGRPVHLLMGPG